jgi:hypothetical protein
MRHRLIATSVASALVVPGVLALGSPAYADGGCNSPAKSTEHFIMSACISKPNPWTLNADAYVDRVINAGGCFDYQIVIRNKYSTPVVSSGWKQFCTSGIGWSGHMHLAGTSTGVGTDSPFNSPWSSELTIVLGNSSYVVQSPSVA